MSVRIEGLFGSSQPTVGTGVELPEAELALISATGFIWGDPTKIPLRQWLYGTTLIRGFVTVTAAPGGLGKSSLTIAEMVAMAIGENRLGIWTKPGGLKVWMINLEDPKAELERRVHATLLRFGLGREEYGDRVKNNIFLDNGTLCTAVVESNSFELLEPVFEHLKSEIEKNGIDVLIVDPFVSTHQISENDIGAIDAVAKRWAKMAEELDIAIQLVHHTRKLNGAEVSIDDIRGASSLVNAARVGRIMNRMTIKEKELANKNRPGCIPDDDEGTYFFVKNDKPNLAPVGKREWYRTVPVNLGNGLTEKSSDKVGVVERWYFPKQPESAGDAHLHAVVQEIERRWEEGNPPREAPQAKEHGIRNLIATVSGLDLQTDSAVINSTFKAWMASGHLCVEEWEDGNRKTKKCIAVSSEYEAPTAEEESEAVQEVPENEGQEHG